jgi:hypothetical protein
MRVDEVQARAHEEILAQYVDLNLDLMSQSSRLTHAEAHSRVQRWVTGHILAYDLRLRELMAA